MVRYIFFFFQAEDGIRDGHVTGVQTCALPISSHAQATASLPVVIDGGRVPTGKDAVAWACEGVERGAGEILLTSMRSEERRVGNECRPRSAAERHNQNASQ